MNFNLTDQIAGVRIFHAANIAKPVNVYVNDRLVVEGLKYSQVTNYLPIQMGRNNIKIRDTATGELLYNQTLTIDGNKFITISAIFETGNLDLVVLEDIVESRFQYDNMHPYFNSQPMNYPYSMYQPYPYGFSQSMILPNYPVEIEDFECPSCGNRQDIINEDLDGLPTPPILGNSARVRFVHLSTNTPAVNLDLANGTRLFTDTRYKQATDYIPVGAGNHTFNLVRFGTDQKLLTVPNLNLLPNETYTIYLVGLLNGRPQLELVLLRDGI